MTARRIGTSSAKKLFVEDVSDEAEAVRQEVAETIARGLMQNRPYRDLADFVFQALCSHVTRARSYISKRGWSLSEEAQALLDTVWIDKDDQGTAAPLGADQTEPRTPTHHQRRDMTLNYRSELEGVLNRPGHMPSPSDGWIGGTGLVSRPAQRRERTAAEITRDLASEPSRDERVFDVLRQEWECPDPVIRQQLLEEYQGHCQICQDGFRKRTGEPFFISKYLVSRTKARTIDRLGNVLCLCATCAAKFQHGAVEMQDPVEHILQLRTVAEGGDGERSIALRLCGEDRRIVFSERHLIDLQELVKQLTA